MRAIMVLIILLTVASTLSCGGTDGGSEPGTEVVASFYPLAFAAEAIGGPAVDVTNLTPAGTEPHDVELSVRDVERVRSADIVLYLGSGFQPAVERAAEGADGEAVDLLDEETVDPHVWLDPLRYAEIAERIGEALENPGAAEAFQQRLEALDAEYKD